jgi:hypothetical protein
MGRVGAVNHDDLQAKADKSVGTGKLKQPEPVQVNGQGKQTQTGSDYVDSASSACSPGDASCFLETSQRERLVSAFQQRTLVAQMNYIAALGQIRVDELLKQDDDLSWVVSLIFNAVFIGAGTALTAALVAFRNTKMIENALSEAEIKAVGAASNVRKSLHGELNNIGGAVEDHSIATGVAKGFHGLSDASVGLIVKQAVDTGKTQVTTAAKGYQNANATSDKAHKLDYITFLQAQSATVFESVRENTPAHLKDDELLALFQAYAGVNHSIPKYIELLTDQIEIYKKSFVTRMGYSSPKGMIDRHAGEGMGDRPEKKVVRCVWVIETNKPGKKVDTVPAPKLMYQTFMIHVEKGEDHYVPFGDMNYHEVEHALTDVAIARHTQVWGTPPEALVIDASAQPAWTNKPPRTYKTFGGTTVTPQKRDLPENEEGK